ncbi:unnamed protein product [Debaryomyces tyrocola]|nr:unnamed protein product [Debaryomyces tyrocola]
MEFMIYGKMVEPEYTQYDDPGTSYEEPDDFFEDSVMGVGSNSGTMLTGHPNCGNTYNNPWVTGVGASTHAQLGLYLSYPTNGGYGGNIYRGDNRMTHGTMDLMGTEVNGTYMDPAIEFSGYNYNLEALPMPNQYTQNLLLPFNSTSSLNSMNSVNALDTYTSASALGPESYSAPGGSMAAGGSMTPGYPSPISHRQSPLQKQKPNLKVKTEKTDTKKRYRIIRGVSAGGCSTRPPKYLVDSNALYLPIELHVNGASVEEICYPAWNASEKEDRRRIIRIERVQNGHKLLANFSIVGGANENPITLPAPPDTDVIEVSCLECTTVLYEADDQSASDDDLAIPINGVRDGKYNQYYITSVEVIEIVELLIGTQSMNPADRRKERGRIRSNLVPFWSRKPISSRMQDNSSAHPSGSPNYPRQDAHLTNQDYRFELAKRIMSYEIRKPRGFDKEVRILRWDKLIPALKRALQTYYTEIPGSDSSIDFS